METKKLIEELYTCSAQCDACYNACVGSPDEDSLRICMMIDRECMEICRLTGSLLESSSVNMDKFVQLCAEICKSCAEECNKHDHDHCRKCAEECTRCSNMCAEYLQHVEI